MYKFIVPVYLCIVLLTSLSTKSVQNNISASAVIDACNHARIATTNNAQAIANSKIWDDCYTLQSITNTEYLCKIPITTSKSLTCWLEYSNGAQVHS